ncbi:hypothetical protein CR513_02555, partial [Mucuna pruriens]
MENFTRGLDMLEGVSSEEEENGGLGVVEPPQTIEIVKKIEPPQHLDREIQAYEAQETIQVRELEEDLAQKKVERKSLKRGLEETTTALASVEQEINKEH